MAGRTAAIYLLAMLLTLVACNPFGPETCTTIGCNSGLRVELDWFPAGAYSLTAEAPGEKPQVIQCNEEATCHLLFRDFTPGKVTITYADGNRTIRQEFVPEYERLRPNGPVCPPECTSATVILNLNQ